MTVMSALVEHPFAITAGLLLLWTVFSGFAPRAGQLPDLPWVGKVSKRPGSIYWTKWAAIGMVREWLNEGYGKASTQERQPIEPG